MPKENDTRFTLNLSWENGEAGEGGGEDKDKVSTTAQVETGVLLVEEKQEGPETLAF